MMAFALYIVLEPRECDDKGLDVQRLASFLHRTPSSVALKIWNIAAYDDNRKARGRVGMKHGSKLDSQVWQWYAEDPDAFMEQCLDLLRHALLQADANDFNPVSLASDRYSSLETATFLLIAEIYDHDGLSADVRENIERYHLYNPTPETFETIFHDAGFSSVQVHIEKDHRWICVEGR